MKNTFKFIFDKLIVAVVFALLFVINVIKFVYRSFHPRSFQHFRFV